MRRKGRKSLLTPRRKKRILELVKLGNFPATVARAVGIHEGTLINWLRKGEEGKDPELRKFYEDYKKAEAEAEVRNLAIVQKAALRDAKFALAFLERRFPERWKPGVKISAEVEAGEETAELLKEMAKARESLKDKVKELIEKVEGET